MESGEKRSHHVIPVADYNSESNVGDEMLWPPVRGECSV